LKMSLVVVHKAMEMGTRKWLKLEKYHSKAQDTHEGSCFLQKRNELCIGKKAFRKGKRLAHGHRRDYTLHRRHVNLSFR
jgi:hypothetical protein